jgi:5-methyltetrahydropteroyltriglutamate--homocysteine methyltransferase
VSRIRTTHTGSLPRPADVAAMVVEREEGADPPGLPERIAEAVGEVVRRQAAAGLDLINDGEEGKSGYSTYVQERLSGFDGESLALGSLPELENHPDFAQRMGALMQQIHVHTPACTGPVALRDPDAVRLDIERLRAAAAGAGIGPERLFMTAASPGVISFFFEDRYYGSREAYLAALADAMRAEYQAITDAGITLQLDCPDLAMSRHTIFAGSTLEEFRSLISLNVEALNHAVRGLPTERLRMHLCWGNYEGPHIHDVALADIIDIVLRAAPAGLSIEASNPRHGHEWTVFEDRALPDGKYLIPGVIDSTTNFVEHPALVAQRIDRYAAIVGPERVVAGTDCGFGTFVGLAQVAPSVVWAKLGALVEGARLYADRKSATAAVRPR